MQRIPLPFTDAVLLVSSRWREMAAASQAVLLLFCVIIPTAVVMLYRYEMRLVKPRTAGMLLVLRLFTVLFLLFVIVFQPVVERSTLEEVQARVLVAIDRSNSMKIADPQRTDVEKLRLARALKFRGDATEKQLDDWIQQYEQKGTVEWVGSDEFPNDAAGRLRAVTERRRQHDEVCQLVDRLTRAGVAQRLLSGEGPDLLGAIGNKHNVEVLAFSREAWDVTPDQLGDLLSKYASARPSEEGDKDNASDKERIRDDATDLSLPLLRALERNGEASRQILGVVLITDGQHNSRTSDSPVKIADRMGMNQAQTPGSAEKKKPIPVYPIALGARRAPPDIAVASVQADPKTVFKDMVVSVEASITISGLRKQEVIVELERPGKVPLREVIQHDGTDGYRSVRFSLKMEELGAHTLTVRVKPVEGEVRRDNNSQPVYVKVADDKAKVLVVDGEARWEFHYLWNALLRDRQMKVDGIVFTQPRLGRVSEEDLEKFGNPKLQWPSDPDALAGYDCIVLGDVTPAQLPLAERIRLEKYVADRGGTLVILAGKRAMPLAFRDLTGKAVPAAIKPGDKEETDPILKLLPILDPHVARPVQGFRPTFTQQGQLTKFLEMDSSKVQNDRMWAELPPHFWGVIGRAKPGAQTLAYVASEEAKAPAPAADRGDNDPGRDAALIVRQNYGFGRVLYVGIDSTWRWRYKAGDVYHHRFWSQVIHWAAADKPLVAGNDHIRFGTREPVYRQGSEIDLVARLADAEKPLTDDALAGARILKLSDDGKEKEEATALVPLKRKPAQPRIMEGKVPPYLMPGKYAVELVIPALAGKLEAAPGTDGKPSKLRASFTVLPGATDESLELGTNMPLLEEIATKSSGKVFTPENAAEVVELLNKRTATIEHNPQNKVWEEWGTLLLFLGLLTVEWVARKLAGLP